MYRMKPWKYLFEGKAIKVTSVMDEVATKITDRVFDIINSFDTKRIVLSAKRRNRKSDAVMQEIVNALSIISSFEIDNERKINIEWVVTAWPRMTWSKEALLNPHQQIEFDVQAPRAKTARPKITVYFDDVALAAFPLSSNKAAIFKREFKNGLLHEIIHSVDPKLSKFFTKEEVKADDEVEEYDKHQNKSRIGFFRKYIRQPVEQEPYVRLGAKEFVQGVYKVALRKTEDTQKALAVVRDLIKNPSKEKFDKYFPNRHRPYHASLLIKSAGVFPRGSKRWKRLVNTLYDEYLNLEKSV